MKLRIIITAIACTFFLTGVFGQQPPPPPPANVKIKTHKFRLPPPPISIKKGKIKILKPGTRPPEPPVEIQPANTPPKPATP